MLLGRQRELRLIDEVLAAARLGKSSRLVIRGEPGIGKTALLEYAASKAESMQLLSARGVEFEADLPFAGLHELLRPALGSIDQLPALHASALRSSLGLGDRIEADRLIVLVPGSDCAREAVHWRVAAIAFTVRTQRLLRIGHTRTPLTVHLQHDAGR